MIRHCFGLSLPAETAKEMLQKIDPFLDRINNYLCLEDIDKGVLKL